VSIFSDFRRLPAAVEQLVEVLGELAQMQREAGPALDRLAALELSRHHFEAEIEGRVLKADGKFKAAMAAEQRERQLRRSYERESIVGPLDTNGKEGMEGDAVLPDHATAGEAEGVRPLRLDVATNTKAHAVRAKFGV